MRKYILILLFSCVVYGEWVYDISAALKKAQEEQKYVLVYFSEQNSCGLCKQFSEKIAQNGKFTKIFKQQVVLCVIDPQHNKRQSLQLFQVFEIDKIPTVMFMTAKGKVFFRHVYNGEKLNEYISFLQNIYNVQKTYEEIVSHFNEKISEEEKQFLCRELSENLKKCPKDAWILKSKFAYHLFHLDSENQTKQKEYAAYLICLYTKLNKDIYITYLKSQQSDYYEKFMAQFFVAHAKKLAHLYTLVYHKKQAKHSPRLQKYALQITKQWKKYSFSAKNKNVILDILLSRALCYKALGDSQNFDVVWKEMLQDYSSHEKVISLQELLKH